MPTFATVIENDTTDDSLAQQVEHNTFNVGVLGSSPRRITKERSSEMKTFSFFGHPIFNILTYKT